MNGHERVVIDIDRERVRAALAGDATAVRALIDAMTPIVQARSARALLRRSDRHGRDVRQEVEDLTQEVFVALFSEDGKALRAWDPQLGLSFPNFVGLLAQRRVSSILRARRRMPWAVEEPASEPALGSPKDQGEHETAVASRDLLERLLEQLRAALSARGYELFHRLYVREETVEEICAQTGLKPHAVHQWKRRLGQAARSMLEDLQREASVASTPAEPSRGSHELQHEIGRAK